VIGLNAEFTGLLQGIKGTFEQGRDTVIREAARTKLNHDRALLLQRLGLAAMELMDEAKLPNCAELVLPRARLREVEEKLAALDQNG